ncbi:hypothetical protein [Streptomyces sp. NPDC001070]
MKWPRSRRRELAGHTAQVLRIRAFPHQGRRHDLNAAFALATLVWGVLSDRIGYRATFVLGSALMVAASAVSAVAPNLATLDKTSRPDPCSRTPWRPSDRGPCGRGGASPRCPAAAS